MGRDEIKMVSGASMGLLCAYALATDKVDVFECAYRNIDIAKGAELFYNVFFKQLLWGSISSFVSSSDRVEIPLAFPICFVPIFSVRYFWILGKYNACWGKYFRAALNFPFLCLLPSFLEHRLALDGGAADNIPLYPLLKQGDEYLGGEQFDLILVLHFDARYDYRKEFDPGVPVLDLDLGICNGFKKNHYDFSREYVAEMIGKAEQYGDRLCERLFGGDCSRETLRRTVDEIFLEEHAVRQKNISADHALSMLNSIGKFFRRERTCNKKLY